ncbi:MAG: hypothetical protein HN527_04120, partial [Rhodospirillaceae bacterium]|nr:hypothetical protein [Rhodospirillaceae bacterium]
MPDSKNKRRHLGFATIFCAALTAFIFAAAQTPSLAQSTDSDAPIRLVPLEEVSPPSETPVPELVLESMPSLNEVTPLSAVETLAPLEELGQAESAAGADNAGVEVGALADINADDIGLLAEQSGGFPNALWHGTRRDLLTLLMPRLPIEARSPAMRTATLKLLLSPGAAPRDETAETGALLRLRADILADMGEFGVAIALLRAAPSGDFEEIIARYDSDRMFLKLDFDGACEQARARIDLSMDAYWQRALIFCQSKNEQFEAASLGLDLLRESGYAPDAAFVTLINGMSGYGEAALNSMPNPSPLLVAMLRNMGIQTPRNALDAANPALLRLIAGAADSDIELRLVAAEQAEAVGALPAASVGALYAQVQFTPEERANPISQSAAMDGPLARAILYQAVTAETVPTARAEVIGVLLESAEIRKLAKVEDVSGFDLSPFNRFRKPYHQLSLSHYAHTALSDDFAIFGFDFTGDAIEPETRPLSVPATGTGTCHAIAFWFRLILDEDHSYDTGADKNAGNHWEQAVHILDVPMAVEAGGDVNFTA